MREKIVDVWYLGTNQNGIIFELLTIHEKLFVELLNCLINVA